MPHHQRGSRSALVRPTAAAIVVVLVVALGGALVVRAELDRTRTEEVAQLRAEMSSTAARLETAVLARTVMADALAAFVTSHQGLEQELFADFAGELMKLEPDVRALQLAPNGVITDVYPLRGNEAAVGLDLTSYVPQREVVARTREAERFVVGGPLDLIQGGRGLIGRLSVWTDEGWWGLVQVVIDLDVVLDEAELAAESFGGQYQLRGVDGLGSNGEPFVNGDLDTAGAERIDVELPGVDDNTWELVVLPPRSGATLARVLPHISGAALLALVAGILSFQLVAAPALLRRRIDDATTETATTAAHLRTVMNAASDGILAVDQRGVVRATNPSASALFERAQDKLEGGHLTEVLPNALQILGHPAAADGGYHARTVGTTSAGAEIPLAVSAAWTTDGSLATVIVRDVTEQEAAHDALQSYAAELETLNAQLTRLDQLKRDFVAMASHEMRTPITTVRGLATTLARTWDVLDDHARQRCVEAIERQTGRLWQVVTDLLLASDIESGETHAPTLPTTVRTMLVEAAASGSGGETEIDIRCHPDLVVALPVTHVQRIVRALVSNAEKYGGCPIVVEGATHGATLTISVRDHGPGVPADFEPELFTRFSQASTGEQRTARGIGLGLAVARGLARSHQGDLHHERPDDGGARFVLEVPVRIVRDPSGFREDSLSGGPHVTG